VRNKSNHCIYSEEEGGCFIYLALYADDMLLIRKNMYKIEEVKKNLSSNLDIKDIFAMNFILGMEIKRYQATRKL
jgi:hypothetical protein